MNVTMQTFGYPETLVKEYDNWVVLLRPEQVTVGTLVLVEKSEATHLGQLSHEAWAEFAQVSQDVESWTRQVFGAEKFNYLALMMRDPNVHFHFVPRYSQGVELDGETFADADWPAKTELGETKMSQEQFASVLSQLRSAS